MQTETKIKFISLLFLFLLPQFSFASSQIISTIKNPDPYNGNQSWYKLSSLSGKTIEDSLILKNLGSETETIKLYATDATSNQAGSFISKLETDPQNSIGKWTTLEKSEITLTPNEDKEVKFKINIPENTSPGEYFGSIMKEDLNTDCSKETANNCTGGIQIKTRTGNRIYLTVPGKIIEDIKLTNFSYKNSGNQSIFKFNIQNHGNTSFEPQATINIYNYWGEKIDSITKSLGTSLPNTSIEPMVEWKHQANYGFLTAKADISYQPSIYSANTLHSSSLSERKEISIFIFPWTLTIILFSIFSVIIILIYLRKKHQTSIISNTTEYTVQPDENIIDIAKKHQIRWTVLAQINKLQAPYIIKPEQKIKIPKSKTQHE